MVFFFQIHGNFDCQQGIFNNRFYCYPYSYTKVSCLNFCYDLIEIFEFDVIFWNHWSKVTLADVLSMSIYRGLFLCIYRSQFRLSFRFRISIRLDAYKLCTIIIQKIITTAYKKPRTKMLSCKKLVKSVSRQKPWFVFTQRLKFQPYIQLRPLSYIDIYQGNSRNKIIRVQTFSYHYLSVKARVRKTRA